MDFVNFYADAQLAMRQENLAGAGDHVFIHHGQPHSWADGTRIFVGEDLIDFDIAIKGIDQSRHLATIVIRHLPPKEPGVKVPADWMRAPVVDAPNNWVQVLKTADGSYRAAVGKETFDAEVQASLIGGKILAATMDNVVQAVERKCTSAALRCYGDLLRFQIHRQITIRLLYDSEVSSRPGTETATFFSNPFYHEPVRGHGNSND